VPPPSRDKENAGAFAPSTRAGRAAGGAPLPVDRSESPAFAVLRTDFLVPPDFNALDGGLCDAFGAELRPWLFFMFLPDLLADGVRSFADVFFAEVLEVARRVAWTKDFLRLFLDIRLPFVAFRRSIIAVLRQAGIMRTAGWAGSAQSMLKASSIRHPFAPGCGLCRDDERGY
jgi:hypothetical protein